MEGAHSSRKGKYIPLAQEIKRKSGYKCEIFAVEIGARGLIGNTMVDCLKGVGIRKKNSQTILNKLSITALSSSKRIFLARNSVHWAMDI